MKVLLNVNPYLFVLNRVMFRIKMCNIVVWQQNR